MWIVFVSYKDELFTTLSPALTTGPFTTPSEHETTSKTSTGYENGHDNERQTQDEWIEDIPNAVVAAASAILVVIGIALIIMGCTLWKKR